MTKADTGRTVLFTPFAGYTRKFRLPIGKIADLERLCGAGIGAIMMRLGTHQFKAVDIWETIRLGLEGGGMTEPDATALCMSYHDEPLIRYAELAAKVLQAAVNGVPVQEEDDLKKNEPTTSPIESQGTSHTYTPQPAL